MTGITTERRTDLDWIRIGAFALLILYHVGMYYTTWGFHVKSPHVSRTVDVLMLMSNPWRLGLLFFVSGAATCFMAAKLRPGRLAAKRSLRLLVPLAFGMLVVIPPQSYCEVVEKLGFSQGFFAFYARYLAADHGFCFGRDCLILPTWNHLWFVAYLWVYTILMALLLWAVPTFAERGTRLFGTALRGAGLYLWPILLLAAARVLLLPLFPSTHALAGDWYNHAVYLFLFLAGFFLLRADGFWEEVERRRWLSLGLAVAGYVVLGAINAWRAGLPEVARVAFAVDQWCAILAILGFGRRWLSGRDGPARRYLTDAMFPYYIVHQTAIILLAHALKPLALPPAIEAPLILLGTVVSCVVTYEIVRRVGLLRPLFGLKSGYSGLRPASLAKRAHLA